MRLNILNDRIEILIDVTQQDIDQYCHLQKLPKLILTCPVTLAIQRETGLDASVGEMFATISKHDKKIISLLSSELQNINLQINKNRFNPEFKPKPVSSYMTAQGTTNDILNIIREFNLKSS